MEPTVPRHDAADGPTHRAAPPPSRLGGPAPSAHALVPNATAPGQRAGLPRRRALEETQRVGEGVPFRDEVMDAMLMKELVVRRAPRRTPHQAASHVGPAGGTHSRGLSKAAAPRSFTRTADREPGRRGRSRPPPWLSCARRGGSRSCRLAGSGLAAPGSRSRGRDRSHLRRVDPDPPARRARRYATRWLMTLPPGRSDVERR